ncbi:hypothetical protein G7067_02530 [Leucobacter insecticola]|uniref:Ig-like domain-containing protein n=1 Tax=Leucobacter insecticola TaxID=2714934 RepID=A0A6G8FGM6_9MICO|nr:InlB B-repeat-containing protein [Leucobacter insecticola]QIM15541.1 hypothetical protein G7067_02530 [Leucobacter insecticola]
MKAESIGGYFGAFYATGSDGQIYTWGQGANGKLGQSTAHNVMQPTVIDAEPKLVSIRFGDNAATNTSMSEGTWTATSPSGCGAAQITASWFQFDTQPTGQKIVKTNDYDFVWGSAPAVTSTPQDAAVTAGSNVTLTSSATGDPAPTVKWQRSSTAQGPWTDVSGQTSTTLTYGPTATEWVRAVFTNCVTQVATNPAKVSLLYSVTFNAQNGSAATTAMVADGGLLILPEAPTLAGYSFVGWATTADGATMFDPSTPVTGDLTLYAQWANVVHTVTFDAQNGSATTTAAVADGGTVMFPTVPSRPGYAFAGWATDPAGTTMFDPSSNITSDLTLYGQWTKDAAKYMISFDPQGGSAVASVEVVEGEVVALPEAPSRTGYTFAGWTTDAAGENAFDASMPVTGNMTLYGQWKKSTTSPGGGSGGGESGNGGDLTGNGGGGGQQTGNGNSEAGNASSAPNGRNLAATGGDPMVLFGVGALALVGSALGSILLLRRRQENG